MDINMKLICGDSVIEMAKMAPESVRCVITSPPYNLGVSYNKYDDNLPRKEYLEWTSKWVKEVKRILTFDGHFFLNVGYTNQDPWVAMDVAQEVRKYFVLQNNITWIKHIKIDKDTYGIYKPIKSERYTTPTNESVFHFTKNGDIKVDRLSISGEYSPRKGRYAASYTEEASLKRHEADLRRRIAKQMGHKDWRDCLENSEFQKKYQEALQAKPFQYLAAKDEGNSWYIPYTPIALLAKEVEADEKGTKATGRADHPATFPVGLPKRCIQFAGLKKKDVVLDPFLGTGTTLMACLKLGVRGIGIDLDEHYITFAQHRIDCYIRNKEEVQSKN